MPAVARPAALAVLLLVAASAHLAARAEPAGRWVPLLVVAVAGAVATGSPTRLWPLPAIWLVATALGTTVFAPTTGGAPGQHVTVALVCGVVAFALAVAIDVVPVLWARRRVRS